MEDYYSILGVPKNAKDGDIKKAYRKLSYEYHPDKTGGDRNKEETYKKINEAYEVLKEPFRRNNYDMELFMTTNNNISNTEHELGNILGQLFGNSVKMKSHHNKSNLFNNIDDMMFMSFTSPQGLYPPPHNFNDKEQTIVDIHKNIEITFQQAYNGISIPITITREILNGKIVTEENETLYINIPKGVDHNEIITLEKKGNKKDNYYSDIKIHIQLKHDNQFKRQGMDLIYIHNISFKESLLGFSFILNHINGEQIKINNSKGKVILNKSQKIIKNLGFSRNNTLGNLILEFHIKEPEPLNEKQIELLEDFFK